MECREVRQLADAYVSDQVLVETVEAIGAHLEGCRSCRAEIEGLRRVRASVRSAVQGAPDLAMRPEFAAALAQRLQVEATRVAPADTSRRVWLALAASTLLAVGLGFGLQRRSSMAWVALVDDAAGDHQNCAITFKLSEAPIPLTDAANRYGGIYRQLESVKPSTAALSGGSLQVLDRHSCVYDGRRFVHIVLRYKATTASVLVTADTRPGRWPWEARTGEGALLDLGVSGSYTMASFLVGRQVAFVVSSLGHDDVQEVALAMTGPVSRALAGA